MADKRMSAEQLRKKLGWKLVSIDERQEQLKYNLEFYC